MSVDGFEPDKVTYDIIIRGLCLDGKSMEALSILIMMQKRGLVPNEVSYNNLVECLYTVHSNVLGLRIFEEMVSHGFYLKQHVYNKLLINLSEENKLGEAHKILLGMLKGGHGPDQEAKRLLMEACIRQREFDMASRIQDDIVMVSLGQIKLLLGCNLWKSHTENAPLRYPSDSLCFFFREVLCGFVKQGYMEDAGELFNRMIVSIPGRPVGRQEKYANNPLSRPIGGRGIEVHIIGDHIVNSLRHGKSLFRKCSIEWVPRKLPLEGLIPE
ncbi:hypothetical protein QJS10_CPB20g01483 [Acorus calamus]|uniref:Pentatricopeptide repeat-containing protein n=1 Tax=Acorus calamus TaxID=4465 RepID=A0AAV9CA64_ACOCL|nr:hypothetical protein QJS10_CPB20g01483 [Acorus calamus]